MKSTLRLPFLLSATLALGTLATSTEAKAKNYIERPHRGARPKLLDLHVGGVGYYGGGGLFGVRLGIPLLKNGFIPDLNNTLHIVLGADMFLSRWYGERYDYGRFGLHIPILVNWELYFAKEWSGFVEIGPALTFFPAYRDYDAYWGWRRTYGILAGGIGARFHFSKKSALVFRLGSPVVSLGLTIKI